MINDKFLAHDIYENLRELDRLIDEVGPTPLRRKLSQLRADMLYAIHSFDEDSYHKQEPI